MAKYKEKFMEVEAVQFPKDLKAGDKWEGVEVVVDLSGPHVALKGQLIRPGSWLINGKTVLGDEDFQAQYEAVKGGK